MDIERKSDCNCIAILTFPYGQTGSGNKLKLRNHNTTFFLDLFTSSKHNDTKLDRQTGDLFSRLLTRPRVSGSSVLHLPGAVLVRRVCQLQIEERGREEKKQREFSFIFVSALDVKLRPARATVGGATDPFSPFIYMNESLVWVRRRSPFFPQFLFREEDKKIRPSGQ